ncbi:MAG: Holliday junction branch migration protein RuvA [Candidatus Vogelbacteria bacterium]|nr:Holliday junction branch migration protein RuvA [Candidatus Vogelbacteria bacterium]
MIAQLKGQVVGKNERAITVDVGGVGYRVYSTAEILTKIKLGQALTLHTHLAVREDALELFGFTTKLELDYFHLLLTVPGIGPKSALAVLSLAAPEILQKAIRAQDTDYLTRVSGLGRKSAEKIVLTLKDKLAPGDGENKDSIGLRAEAEALEALEALGYSAVEARAALKQTGESETGAKIKAALKTLAGR